ncbi:MAG: Ig-like domain-containing protein [Clostridia bacterium]|nr:Ig-like domain-containing protein [Clostridia bacterium]
MKKTIIFFFAIITVIALMFILAACGNSTSDNNEGVDDSEVNKETPKVFLEKLTLDDSRYTLEFDKETTSYKIDLPDGRPTVPRVKATAKDGVDVKISQAAIPDGEKSGFATVSISDKDGNKNIYKIEFVRNRANGFVLQYDDRYEFLKNENDYVFESSAPETVAVDENGLMTAKKVSNTAVTITAKTKSGEVKETLKIDRVEKAHINLFFITGQSNGQGCYDSTNYGKDVEYLIKYEDQLSQVEKIGEMGRVYSFDVHPVSMNSIVSSLKGKMYDMEKYTKQGHQAALGKTFYELSGEKVVFLQSAYSGAPIESWLDMSRHEEGGTYNGQNFYATTKGGYQKLIKMLNKNYEIVYTANFWCQGETAMNAVYSKSLSNYIFSSDPNYNKDDRITDQTYYDYFMMLHNDMKEDFGLQYNGIMFTKSKGVSNQTQIVPIVSAHFALCNNNDDIHVASRNFIEIATQYKDLASKGKEGYGFMGTDNNHYNQIGYNYLGKEVAENAFNAIFGVATNDSKGVEIIANNGKDRLESNDTVEIRVGGSTRLGALSYPHYINEKIEWASNKEDVVTVDSFGNVVGVSKGIATVTATSESGQTLKIYVSVS